MVNCGYRQLEQMRCATKLSVTEKRDTRSEPCGKPMSPYASNCLDLQVGYQVSSIDLEQCIVAFNCSIDDNYPWVGRFSFRKYQVTLGAFCVSAETRKASARAEMVGAADTSLLIWGPNCQRSTLTLSVFQYSSHLDIKPSSCNIQSSYSHSFAIPPSESCTEHDPTNISSSSTRTSPINATVPHVL